MASISANGSKGHHKFTLNVTETGTSVENNTSTVSFSFVLSPIQTSWDWNFSNNVPVSYSIVINGTQYTGNIMKYDGSSTVTVQSGTLTVAHNDDGNKTISFSFSVSSLNYSYLPGSANASGSMPLSFIARASQPSLITYPESTQNVGEFGDTISIHMNRKSSSFTHTVRYAYGNLSGTIATGVTNGTTWTIPLSFMDLIPNALSGSGTIYVDTYNGSTFIGTKYTGFTATVPANIKPTVSLSGRLDDITGVEDIYGSPVKGLSKIKITPSASGAYSSKITSYHITANGVNYYTAEATTGFLATSGASVVSVTVTDSRGRTASASYTMNVQDYAPPAITALTAVRCNEDGTTNKRGAFIKATFSAVVSAMGNKNTSSYSIQYKKTSESDWTDLESDISGFAPTDQSFVFAAKTGNSYDVLVTAVDRHNTATKSTKAPTAFSVFSWRGFKNSSGNKEDGVGIGKVPEKPNVLQVGWDAEFEKEIYYKGKTLLDFVYPVGSIYIAYNHTDPGTLFGGTWVRMQDGFLWASRSTDIIGQTGGSKTNTLTSAQMPRSFIWSDMWGESVLMGHWTEAASNPTNPGFSPVNGMQGGTGYGRYNTLSVGHDNPAAVNNMPPYIQVSMWRRTA